MLNSIPQVTTTSTAHLVDITLTKVYPSSFRDIVVTPTINLLLLYPVVVI